MKYFIIAKDSVPQEITLPETTVFAGTLMTEDMFLEEAIKEWPDMKGKTVNEMVININMDTDFLVLMVPDA